MKRVYVTVDKLKFAIYKQELPEIVSASVNFLTLGN